MKTDTVYHINQSESNRGEEEGKEIKKTKIRILRLRNK